MRQIELIALDLDGTLLNSQKKLSQRNKEILSRCAQAGIQVVPATGRAADGIIPEVRALPGVTYAIATNGGVVANIKTGENLLRCTLSNETALRIFNIIKDYHIMYDPYINGRGITEPRFIDHMEEFGLSPVMQEMVRFTRDVVPNVIEFVRQSGKDVEKINIYMADLRDREALVNAISQVPGLVISSSLYNNIEINAEGATKGNALLWLADYLKIPREATVAFGDGGNDISMLKAAGIGIAMGNGLEQVKAAADQVTGTNDEDGVAEAIERLVPEIRTARRLDI